MAKHSDFARLVAKIKQTKEYQSLSPEEQEAVNQGAREKYRSLREGPLVKTTAAEPADL